MVVGDQSSGKSSLLEGLTALPFPVAGELCTRFATQVSLRRSSKAACDVYTISIIPAADSSDQYKRKLTSFQTTLHEFDEESFSKVLRDVMPANYENCPLERLTLVYRPLTLWAYQNQHERLKRPLSDSPATC